MEKKIILKLEKILTKYNENNKKLSDVKIFSNPKKLENINKEQKQISNSVNLYINYKNLVSEINDAEKLLLIEKDEEMVLELKKIINNNKKAIGELEFEIIRSLIPKDPNDYKNCIVEIKGAAGGDEANIFAGNLFEMYQKYALKNNFKIKIDTNQIAEAGGFSYLRFYVNGEGAYGKFKYESGVHRVQRVPSTESLGRIHTSTVIVSVIPEADEIDVEINASDLRIDTYRSSGAGGQHVNKTDSAVRITHLPTGIVVTSQDGRSQHDNKDKAMSELRNKIYSIIVEKQEQEINKKKKIAFGTGARSEKIRTYNYPQNRVTDHRINLTIKKLDQILDGKLDEIIDVLISIGNEED